MLDPSQLTFSQLCFDRGWSFHQDGTEPKGNEVFVFGSNLSGHHGEGAAYLAFVSYGAKMGVGYGPTGHAYAVPTKQRNWKYRLTIEEIKEHTDAFAKYTRRLKTQLFWVTGIGCGYSRYKPEQMAPLFWDCINCSFPDTWMMALKEHHDQSRLHP